MRKTGVFLAAVLLATVMGCGSDAKEITTNEVVNEATDKAKESEDSTMAESNNMASDSSFDQKETKAAGTFNQISQDEAKSMMAADDGHIIVDVRRQDEYDAGHIPGAVLIPNESIGTQMPAELPDLDQIILVYCRSGNRSKQASQKLADMGYTNIYEFGGINTWTGEIVTAR